MTSTVAAATYDVNPIEDVLTANNLSELHRKVNEPYDPANFIVGRQPVFTGPGSPISFVPTADAEVNKIASRLTAEFCLSLDENH